VAGRRGQDQQIADGQDASSDLPEQPVPVLSDDQVRGLLAACSGKDFRDRRDAASAADERARDARRRLSSGDGF
jgi:hypothetical protein